jgi:hypothetical protein
MRRLGTRFGRRIGSSSASSAPEVPISLGAYTWLRETYTAGATMTWVDKTGNGHDLVQSTAANQPSVISAVPELGFRPAMRFDGSNDYFVSGEAASAWKFLHDGTGCDVFIIMAHRRTSVSAIPVLSTGDGGTGANGAGLLLSGQPASGILNLAIVGNGGGRIINDQTSVGTIWTEPQLREFYYLEGRPTNEWANLKSKNASHTGNTGNVATAYTGDPAATLNIGRNHTGAAYFLGDVSEVVIFDRVLSTDERTQMRNYFHTRYGFINAVSQVDVDLGWGDSEMLGRGAPTDLATELPGYAAAIGTDQNLWCEQRTLPSGTVLENHTIIYEPTKGGTYSVPGNNGVGPLGIIGYLQKQVTGRRTIVVNTGVGGSRTAQWVSGQTNYNLAVTQFSAAMAQPGAVLRSYQLFIGLNDAALPDDGAGGATITANLVANIQSTFTSLIALYGAKPIYIMRYPATVPTDTTYFAHAPVRAGLLTLHGTTISGATVTVVDAPDGPWVESPQSVHLDTAANVVLAQSVSALM